MPAKLMRFPTLNRNYPTSCCWITVLLIGLLLIGCGGNGSSAPSGSSNTSVPSLDQLPRTLSLEEACTEVTSARTPVGVDGALFNELQDELVRVLSETAKAGSTPPTGSYNAVTDVVLLGNDGEGWRLEWTYRNTGDYNRDGLVGVSDLTPVGQNYDTGQFDQAWTKARFADGSNDGLITVADITPIGQNYNAFLAGYRIFGAALPGVAGILLGEVSLPAAPASGAWVVSYDLAANDHAYYRVESVDGGGVVGTTSWQNLAVHEPAVVTMGVNTIQDTVALGTAGGELAGLAGTPLAGVSVNFPPDALLDDRSIELGWNDGTITPVDGVFAGPIIELGDDGAGMFLAPVLITVPFTVDENYVPVLYDIAADGSLSAMRFEEINFATGKATFSTYHASPKALINARQHFADISEIGSAPTGFNPGRDGFQIKNLGSDLNSAGECLGMAAFAVWYFENKHYESHGRLFNSFMTVIEDAHYGWNPSFTKYVQDVIATRAHTSAHIPFVQTYWKKDWELRRLPDAAGFAMIRGALLETGQPVILGTFSPEIAMGHSMTCYSLGPVPELLGDYGIVLKIYDPAFPGEARSVFFLADSGVPNWDEAVWGVYDGPVDYNFTEFVLDGYGSLNVNEPFDTILHDALLSPPFGGSDYATVSITSHAAEEEVQQLPQIIAGHIQDGEVYNEGMLIYIEPYYSDLVPRTEAESKQYILDQMAQLMGIEEDGNFSVPVELFPGKNEVQFLLYGLNASGQIRPESRIRFVGTGWDNSNSSTFYLTAPTAPVVIDITSHVNGEIVPSDEVTLTGTITSPDVGIVQVIVHDGSSEYPFLISPGAESWGPVQDPLLRPRLRDGLDTFSMNIKLQPGTNELFFETSAQEEEIEVYEVDIPNNYETTPFILVVDAGPDPEPGQLRFDIQAEPRSTEPDATFLKSRSNRPTLAMSTAAGLTWIGGYTPGILTSEPFALYEDLTVYDDENKASTGWFRITAANLQPGTYSIMMRACQGWGVAALRVTKITASGIASGSWVMQNGAPAANEDWYGVDFDTPPGVFTLHDRIEEHVYSDE